MRVSGISFQMGVCELVSVNLGVLDMKQFENHCPTKQWALDIHGFCHQSSVCFVPDIQPSFISIRAAGSSSTPTGRIQHHTDSLHLSYRSSPSNTGLMKDTGPAQTLKYVCVCQGCSILLSICLGGKRNTFLQIVVFIKRMQSNVIFVLLGIMTS